jgi:hypothetical protein
MRGMAATLLLLCASVSPLEGQAPVGGAVRMRADLTPVGGRGAMQGTVEPSDPILRGRGRLPVMEFDAVAGRRYLLSMRSSDFDAYLAVARVVDGVTEVLREDDDGLGDSDAQIVFQAPWTDRYLLLAQAFDSTGLGRFTVTVEELAVPAAPQWRMIAMGQAIEGTLSPSSSGLPDGSLYNGYVFRGHDFEELEWDDDGGGESDAELQITFDADGEYVIRATSFRRAQTGAYTLSIRRR